MSTRGNPLSRMECKRCGKRYPTAVTECPRCGGKLVLHEYSD